MFERVGRPLCTAHIESTKYQISNCQENNDILIAELMKMICSNSNRNFPNKSTTSKFLRKSSHIVDSIK